MSELALEIVEGPDIGQSIALEDELEVGHSAECCLSLSDDQAGEHHARLYVLFHGVVIEDLASGAPTLVNDEPTTETLLTNGDVITIGATKLRFKVRTATAPAGPIQQLRATAMPQEFRPAARASDGLLTHPMDVPGISLRPIGGSGHAVALTEGLTIGRAGCDVEVDDSDSLALARAFSRDGQWHIENLGVGAIYVNGDALDRPRRLAEGDCLRVDESRWVLAAIRAPREMTPPMPVPDTAREPASAAAPAAPAPQSAGSAPADLHQPLSGSPDFWDFDAGIVLDRRGLTGGWRRRLRRRR